MKNILLVEDDAETIKLLQLHFYAHLYNLVCCSNGKDAISKIEQNTFDLIILDISLPDMTGLEICKHMRDFGFSVPVIMLTSRSLETDKVLALDLGADDYVTKPFGNLEFMSRVKALLRRAEKSQQEPLINKKINYKDLVIDVNKSVAILRDERIDLTPKEFDLLVLLASNPGKTFNRSELLEQVWGTQFEGYVNVVTTLINRLRNKLETDINRPEYILTSWGTGYRFPDK